MIVANSVIRRVVAELMVKLVEFCGFSVTLRCQLPDGDLEMLVSIKSDEDLASIIEEYDRASSNRKIRAVLSPVKLLKQASPPQSTASSVEHPIYKSPLSCYTMTRHFNSGLYDRRSSSPPHRVPLGFNCEAGKLRCAGPRYYAPGELRISCSAPCCCNYLARLPETEVQRNLRTN